YPATGGVSKSTSYAYDSLERLTTETWYQGGSVTGTLGYAYDAVGNQTWASKTFGSNTYSYTMSYDAANRMTVVQEPFGVSLTFSYDSAGNRTLVEDSFGGYIESWFDADNRLSSRAERQSGTDNLPQRIALTYTANGLLSTLTRYGSLNGGFVY